MAEVTDRNERGLVIRLGSVQAVEAMAAAILDPERHHAIVCVTVPTWASEPLVDPAALSAALGGAAEVYVLATGDLSWELTSKLPPRLDVYGGAVRVWWPLPSGDVDPREHPLLFVHSRSESDATVKKVVAAFERKRLFGAGLPEVDSELAGVVTEVLPAGARLTLTGGIPAFVYRSHITKSDLPPERVVRVGQAVRARVGRVGPEGSVHVSLLAFEPDPWQRLGSEYRPGMIVVGRVDEFRNFGAFIELMPGARGLLHKSQISREWVSHPEDFLSLGERIAVRVVALDEREERAELSLLDLPDDADPVKPISVFPDGPPWLGDEDRDTEPMRGDRQMGPAATATTDLPPSEDIEPGGAAQAAVSEPQPRTDSEAEVGDAVEQTTGVEDSEGELHRVGEATAPELSPSAPDDAQALALVREEADALEDKLDRMLAAATERLEEMRGNANEIRRRMERDLADAKVRILELAEQGTSELVGSTEAALAEARAQADELREQLAAVEADRREMLDRLKEEKGRMRAAEDKGETRARELADAQARIRSLETILASSGTDAAQAFIEEVRSAWERTTPPGDRGQYAWRELQLGPEFLNSVSRVQGVSRDRIVEVTAHVVSRRAATLPGLELHPLRVSEGGGTEQRERNDGAKAWRCSLQVKTPSARRLHYWELPSGGVELAKIVYHDDYSIR